MPIFANEYNQGRNGIRDLLDCFYHVVQNPKKHIDRAGRYQGFPLGGTCIVQRDCKQRTIREIRAEYLEGSKTAEVLGLAADEFKRLGQLHERKRSFLVDFGIKEYQTYDILKPYGLVSTLYTHAKRNGCWFCPNQSYSQLAWLKEHYPEYWEMLRELSHVENTVSKGFKWGVPFDEVEKKSGYLYVSAEAIEYF